ncbi:MAG: hypothetical protein U0264_12260 [Candidatus Kapaibacterium sp.]
MTDLQMMEFFAQNTSFFGVCLYKTPESRIPCIAAAAGNRPILSADSIDSLPFCATAAPMALEVSLAKKTVCADDAVLCFTTGLEI